jgi:hypothetical protein
MNEEQNKIIKMWVKAGLIADTKHWPFQKHDTRAIQKQQLQNTLAKAEEALL